jgi:hypothetical protein
MSIFYVKIKSLSSVYIKSSEPRDLGGTRVHISILYTRKNMQEKGLLKGKKFLGNIYD